MNNNTSTVNSNSTDPSSSVAMPKNFQKVNGTDNNSYCTNDVNSQSSSRTEEAPCNTCQRGASAVTTADLQNQQNSGTSTGQQPGNLNNVVELRENIPPHLSTDDEEDCADSDDQYCVYTYKGDGSSQQPNRLAADLPSSFFKLHPSDSSSCPPSSLSSEIPSLEQSSSSSRCCHSNSTGAASIQNGSLHHHSPGNVNNNAMYSPDMDFLEMDFDPGGSGDGCCDGDDEDDDEDVVRDHIFPSGAVAPGSSQGSNFNFGLRPNVPVPSSSTSSSGGNNNQVLNDDQASAAVVLSKLVVTRSNGGGGFISSDSTNTEPVAHCSKRSNEVGENVGSSSHGHNSATANSFFNNCNRTDEIKLRLVKSVTLPEMGTSNSSPSYSGASGKNNPSRAMAMSISAPVFQDKLDGPCPTVIPAGKSSEVNMYIINSFMNIYSYKQKTLK